ncbi:cytochrome P450 CYP12A2-like [Prorops nasuta]|uniref:cytochrome P450 CYP12A2-like n=1 Tax=Prorops nasuta TaxID=863751 RepID=UPI0034CF0783
MKKALTLRRLESFAKIWSAGLHNKAATQSIEASQIDETEISWDVAKPYEDIPGPKPLPLIGNTFRFIPYIGEFGNMSMVSQLRNLRETYGEVVKLEGILNRRTCIFLFSPELCEDMYRVQGRWPSRVAMESLHHYRLNRECFYKDQIGLTTTQGKQWHDFRSKVNQHLMQPRAIKPHVSQINEVADDFLTKIRELRDPTTLEVPGTFNNEMNKWALESICVIALDHRLGCLKSNLAEDSEPQKMINCVHDMFHLMFQLEVMPSMWKIYNTPDLKRMFRVLDTLNEIAIKYINQAKERLSNQPSDNQERSILEKLLRIDEQTARVMSMDMLTAGVDTTSNASGTVLYYLTANMRAQEKLREEIKSVLPEKNSPVTYESLNNIPYTKACIKEALRLSPIAIGTLRTMQKDVVIGGYRIPEGSDVIAAHASLSQDESQFPRAEEFIPERWLRENSEFPLAKDAHPFAYMPFGFGARTCIGRRFAELEMETLIMKVIRNFRIEWNYGPLEYRSRFINTIASPLKLKFVDL